MVWGPFPALGSAPGRQNITEGFDETTPLGLRCAPIHGVQRGIRHLGGPGGSNERLWRRCLPVIVILGAFNSSCLVECGN